MPVEIVMPKLGLNAQEGLLVEWYKTEGDLVEKGEPLFAVETEKATMDSEAPESGVLGKIVVPEGGLVPVKTVVAYLLKEGEASPADWDAFTSEEDVSAQAPEAIQAGAPDVESAGRESTVAKAAGWVLASPIARRMAADHGLDLGALQSRLGVDVVHEADVLKSLGEGGRLKNGVEKLSGVRAVIAERMATSLEKAAQFTLHAEVDVTPLVRRRTAVRESGAAPGYNAYIARALADVLPDYAFMNAHAVADGIAYQDAVNIGLAVDTPEGLKVVVVKNASGKSVETLDREMRVLAQKALDGTIKLANLEGSTFTLTNLGAYGVDRFTPILNYPEVAILGVGRIQEKLVIVDGKVTQRFMVTFSLTIDHRLVDGAPAARFLQAVGQALNE